MKVLFFSYAYPNPVQPGLGTFNRSMIKELAADHKVRVVAPVSFLDVWKKRLTGKLSQGLNDPSFSAVPGVPAEYLTYYYSPKVFRNQYGRWMWWSVHRRLNQTMRTFRPDLVLSYWSHPDGEVAVRMAHRHGVPAVVMIGGSDVLVLGRSGGRRRKILDVLHRANAVVTVSEHIATTLANDGIDPSKLHVVRRGVDRVLFSPGDQRVARRGLGQTEGIPLIAAVGRLVPVKGFEHLIRACRLLADRDIAFGCRIIGDGPLREQLQRQIVQLKLEDRVQLVGAQAQNQLAEWYRAVDLVVLPSLSEGVPNVLLEAIACNKSFVASNVGGVPEIADKNHDRLVAPSDAAALADAIQNRLNSRSEDLAPRSFEPLELRAASRRLEQVLEQTCEQSRRWQRTCDNSEFGAIHETTFDPNEFLAFPNAASLMDAKIRLTANRSVEVELGRTAEDFVLPQKH
jgi:teichuronic acid biosynthesis glycosyltransferase TuaC